MRTTTVRTLGVLGSAFNVPCQCRPKASKATGPTMDIMLPQLPALSRRPSLTPTCTKVNSTSATVRSELGARMQILEVDEMPEPMPSSWRP